ncbi:MAG: heparin lyase I family protein [Bryobacteraceae bacterium]|jgi:hypothetical protein
MAAGATHFEGDANRRGNLAPWDHFKIGETDYRVSDHPSGLRAEGSVTIVPDPLGSGNNVYKLTVTASSNFAASSARSDRVDLWNNLRPYLGQEGEENWEHFQVLFPSAGDAYQPAPGMWNWVAQHHNDQNYKRFIASGEIKQELPELCWGVDSKAKLPTGETATELFMAIRGGDDLNQPKQTIVHTDAPLLYDHWYDMLVHVRWSHDPSRGLVEWWLDGQLIYSQPIADLWLRPDGTTDHVNFELSNYRIHAEWDSTIYYGRVKLGTTRESVSY